MKTSKLEHIDVARGIGIILVVIGHAIIKDFANKSMFYYCLRQLIYTIHMPLFFTISGILYEKNKQKYNKGTNLQYIKSKFSKFIIPYFSFSIIVYLMVYSGSKINFVSNVLIQEGFIINSLLNTILSILTYHNHIDNHLWFLYVMFLLLCINKLFIKNINIKNTIILLILYFVSYYITNYSLEIIWKTIRYLFIFQFGRIMYCKTNKLDKKQNNILALISFFIFFIILIFCKQTESKLVPLITILVELSSSYIIIFIISQKNINNKILKKLGNGENSMAIYLLHMPFITTSLLFILIKLKVTTFIAIIITSIVSVLFCIISYNYIFAKIPIIKKLIFGNNK